jgi:hypothetical protein
MSCLSARGRHIRLLFPSSSFQVADVSGLIHCDLCTSPHVSVLDISITSWFLMIAPITHELFLRA